MYKNKILVDSTVCLVDIIRSYKQVHQGQVKIIEHLICFPGSYDYLLLEVNKLSPYESSFSLVIKIYYLKVILRISLCAVNSIRSLFGGRFTRFFF